MQKLTHIIVLLLLSVSGISQVATTKTENYKASFETKIDISQYMDYDGKKIPVQILNCGINEEVYEMYPELKAKRVGLGVANISMEYLENLNRFMFTESSTELKNRMVKQFQASQAGISEDKLDGRGKIRLAHFFVIIQCYDFSVSEDEEIRVSTGVKETVVTRIGLQIRFTNAETGEVFSASGLGEAKTTREASLLNDDNLSEIKFNQSTIGTATKKALEISCSRILERMIKRKIFDK
jgi:hypothetical protein